MTQPTMQVPGLDKAMGDEFCRIMFTPLSRATPDDLKAAERWLMQLDEMRYRRVAEKKLTTRQ